MRRWIRRKSGNNRIGKANKSNAENIRYVGYIDSYGDGVLDVIDAINDTFGKCFKSKTLVRKIDRSHIDRNRVGRILSMLSNYGIVEKKRQTSGCAVWKQLLDKEELKQYKKEIQDKTR